MNIEEFGKKFLKAWGTTENLKEMESDELSQMRKELDEVFSSYLTEKMAKIIVEDHEKRMTASEMSAHIIKLFRMCPNRDVEKEFLSIVADATDREECTEKDLPECARVLCNNDEEECDDVIHKLESLVKYNEPEADDDGDEEEKDAE